MHFPSSREAWKKARDRLAFEELFYLQYQVILQKKMSGESLPAVAMPIDQDRLDSLIKNYYQNLPYRLTGAQQKVMNEIARDMSLSSPMNRLVQGDVGAGKTEVALFSALIAVENGFQTVLMAPTEILATQHYEKLSKRFEVLGKKTGFLAGKIKGKAREKVLKALAEGNIDLLIGTHAVFQDEIKIKKLGLVIIDEQHRFGVNQRDRLRHTGQQTEIPHLLVLSATPIPRSLSLTLYGHLNISILDELPPGRKPIQTIFYEEKNRMQAYAVAKQQLQKKFQVYAVFPLIEESDLSPLKAATIEKEKIQALLPEYRVALIHGQMKPAQKTEIMQQFRDRLFDILVATTVIEVGVDVPTATVMIIENAQRYGLSQLHQLRGRVGRGSDQSFCLLIGKTSTPESKKRLQAMVETTDGFKLAELDLQLRGSGDLIGTRQSGLPDLGVADLIRDLPLVEKAKSYVENILKEDQIHRDPKYQLLLKEIDRKKNREFLRSQLN
jgi:ATP-dependent DNA helicase RecG